MALHGMCTCAYEGHNPWHTVYEKSKPRTSGFALLIDRVRSSSSPVAYPMQLFLCFLIYGVMLVYLFDIEKNSLKIK